VCGFSGINAAFAVALKQRFGDRSCLPSVRYLDSIKFRHLPMFLGSVSLVLWLVGSLGGKEAPLIFFGTFFAWAYLRFVMYDIETGVVGDLRPEFSLATFFPDLFGVRPLVDFAGTVVFQTLFRFGLFGETVKSNATLPTSASSHSAHSHSAHSSSASSSSSTSSDLYRTVDPTAERRRLLAIKAIDDKLAELARQPTSTGMNYPTEGFSAAASAAGGATSAGLNHSASPESSPVHHASTNGHALSALHAAVALPSDEELAKLEASLAKPEGSS
jgi:hypothetical protein